MAKGEATKLMEYRLEAIYATLRSASEQMQAFRADFAPNDQGLLVCQNQIDKAKVAVSEELTRAGIIPF